MRFGMFIGSSQDFSVTKDFMKKIYSVEDGSNASDDSNDDAKRTDASPVHTLDDHVPDPEDLDKAVMTGEQQKVKSEIESRQVF
mmetsp:Transcript_1574/g.2182  ORF Transcript_1574/g.2182 Transcript_1574/m.2182 type:complete len:84 (+) Transcript_1574:1068-1319(+)